MKTLAGQSGAESVAAFHAALMADFMNQDADALLCQGAAAQSRQPAGGGSLWPLLERKGRTADATKFYKGLANSTALGPLAAEGLARIAKGQ